MTRLALLFTLLAAFVFAADISGNWKGAAEGPNGALERTFVFKVDGTTLTGETTSSFLGKSVINDGKIDGDNITFTINARFQDNDLKFTYKGKVSADGKQIKLSSSNPNFDQSIEWTLTRAH